MKRYLRLIAASGFLLAFHLSSTISCAQEPLPPPPPAKDYSPTLWKDLISTEGGFKVRFPDSPKESVERRPNGTVVHSFTYGSDKFIFYSLTYRDLAKPPANADEARLLLKGVRDLRIEGMADKMKLLAEEETTRNGQPAIKLEIQLGDRRLRELDVIKGAIHYNLFVITFSNHYAMKSENAYGEIAMSFLDSFQLLASAAR